MIGHVGGLGGRFFRFLENVNLMNKRKKTAKSRKSGDSILFSLRKAKRANAGERICQGWSGYRGCSPAQVER